MRSLLWIAGVLVFLAGVQLFVFPLRTATYFAWTIEPPMTAVFLGAAYWSSLAFEWSAARRRWWCDARIAVPTVFVFTTLTLVATLLHVDRFHFGAEHAGSTRAVTWAWLAIYAIVPVLMAWLAVAQSRVPGADAPRSHRLPRPLLVALGLEAVALLIVGVGLFVVPTTTATWWPWALTPLTARAVGAWCIGLGVAAAQACWEDDVHRLRPAASAFCVFGVLQTVALTRHGDALDMARPSSWIYLAFIASAVVLGGCVLWAARDGRAGTDADVWPRDARTA
jgi:hypothetical protein